MEKNLFHRNWDAFLGLIIILFDILLYNLSLLAAYYLRWNSFERFDNRYQNLYIIINVFFVICVTLTGLYRGIAKSPLGTQKYNLRRFAYYLSLFLMSYLFMIKGHELSRGVIVIFLLVQYAALDFFHTTVDKIKTYLFEKGIGVKKTIIVGADESAVEFVRNLNLKFRSDYQIVGFLRNGFPIDSPKEIAEKIIGNYEDIESILEKTKVDRIFVVSDSMMRKKYDVIRKASEQHHVVIKMVSPQTLSLMDGAHVKDITGVPLTTEKYRIKVSKIKQHIKRIFDIIFSSVLILLLSPILLLISLSIKLTSQGPVIFKQDRSLFKGDNIFGFYKFRTMREDADEIKDNLQQENETNGALFKMKNDPRVTTVGKFLRRYSIDELPQLFNVIKGDMSLVGPRPLPVKDFDKLKNGKINYDWYTKRGEVKPGITGLWQISGRSKLSFEEMVMLDLYYIENQSIFFDLEILFETIPIVLTSKGAY